MRRVIPFVLAIAVSLSGCSSPPRADDASPGPRSPVPAETALNATEAELLPTDAQALPDVGPESYRTLLGQLRGTPVLVNIWGSWCGPCTREAPALRKAAETYGERVQFLGIDILDDRASAREFMDRFGWRYPSLFDVHGAVRDGLGYIGQPITLIYDASGDVVFEWHGEVSSEQLDTELRKVL